MSCDLPAGAVQWEMKAFLSYADCVPGINEIQGMRMGASPLLDVVHLKVPLLHFGTCGTCMMAYVLVKQEWNCPDRWRRRWLD